MKKIYLLCALLLAASCTSRLDLRSGEPESLLVLNARLRTDESWHRVEVYMSKLRETSCEYVDDAEVDVYINGRLSCQAQTYTYETFPARPANDYHQMFKYGFQAGYYFNAELGEGDEIRIVATRGELQASAQVTVPRAVELLAVDTVTVKQNPYFDGSDALECTLKLKDVPGEDNWMRLLLDYHMEEVSHHDSAPDTLRMITTMYNLPMYFDDDPNLRGEFHSSREQSALNETALNLPLVTNKYCIFTDDGFKDTEYRARVYLRSNSFYDPLPLPDFDMSFISRVSFRLLTFNRDEYLFYQAYTNAKTNGTLSAGTTSQILFEPVTFPSNVEGGLGFVCVEAASSISLDFSREIPAMATAR